MTPGGYNGYLTKSTTPSTIANNLGSVDRYTTTPPYSNRRRPTTIRTNSDGFNGYIERVSLSPSEYSPEESNADKTSNKNFGAQLLEELVGGHKSSKPKKRKYENGLESSTSVVSTKGEPTFINIGNFYAPTSRLSTSSTSRILPVGTSTLSESLTSTRLLGTYTEVKENDDGGDDSNDSSGI